MRPLLSVLAASLLLGCESCLPADDDDSAEAWAELEALCTDLQNGNGCGNPDCADYPPCNIPTLRAQPEWPVVLADDSFHPLALFGSEQTGLIFFSWRENLFDGSSHTAYAVPPPPWEPGVSWMISDDELFVLPLWPWSPGQVDEYVLRMAHAPLWDPGGGDVVLGGLLLLEESDWGEEATYSLLAWRGDDLTPGAPAPATVAVDREILQLSGPVGDIDGDGWEEVAVPWPYGIAVHRTSSDAEGLLAERLFSVVNDDSLLAIDPRRVGDVDDDGVDDLVIIETTRLQSIDHGIEFPVTVSVFTEMPGAPATLTRDDAAFRFEPVPPVLAYSTPRALLGPATVTVGDVNGDGLTDVAISARYDPQRVPSENLATYGSPYSPAVRLFVNPGVWPELSTWEDALELRFPGVNGYPTLDTRNLLLHDLDGDGLDDVVMPLHGGLAADWQGIGTNRHLAAIWAGAKLLDESPGHEIWPTLLIGNLLGDGDEEQGEGAEEALVAYDHLMLSVGGGPRSDNAGVQAIPLAELRDALLDAQE